MIINTEKLLNALSKIELIVEEKKVKYYYVNHLDNTHIIQSELTPTEFLAKHNLKKSAIR